VAIEPVIDRLTDPSGNGGPQPSVRRPLAGMVAIAASFGGLRAMRMILAALPADFPAAVAVVWHRTARQPHLLGHLLGMQTSLAVRDVYDALYGTPIRAGTIYIAPPDQNLVVQADERFALAGGPLLHGVFCSGNVLFASAARVFGTRLLAIVLTGRDADGSDGVRAVKQCGGYVIVQDPYSAEAPEMPRAAIATGAADRVLAIDDIGPAVVRWAVAG
jgi:two-component system, chemotaxis family, protein-glutamate methylesterase/glutaminase